MENQIQEVIALLTESIAWFEDKYSIFAEISFWNYMSDIVIFILGRILGILLLIGLLYWFVYLIILAIYPFLPKKFQKGSPYGPTPWWMW